MYQQSWAAEKGRAKAKIILKFLSEYRYSLFLFYLLYIYSQL